VSSVEDVVACRNITDVLHFTTNKGLVGILGCGSVLSRQRLPSTKYVEHVYQPNAKVRTDGPWIDHVNLSISRLNWEFFAHSRRWHQHDEVWWCALVFGPEVMHGDGVAFATTNNIYPSCQRATGGAGLEALFADPVLAAYGRPIHRPQNYPANWTTCHQAEVLVPESVPTTALRRVIVATGQHQDIVSSQLEILLGDLPIEVNPDAFEVQTNP
jgi:hypothetical protein